MSNPGSQQSRQQSEQVPPHLVGKEFGKIYVRKDGNTQHVEFTLWVPELQGSEAEGWQTGVALDASASMKNWYGRNLTGTLPANVSAEYERKGWIATNHFDGRAVKTFKKEAYQDAIDKGYLQFTQNVMEPIAQEFIAYLAGQLDADGGTTVIYWACGDGSAFEVIDDFTEEQCRTLKLAGPQKTTFGLSTKLVPAMKYFVDRFKDADRAIYVFLTDGKLDDLDAVKKYTTQLAKEIQAGSRKQLKCVLIGVGDEIDESQMEELDDLDTGTDVDIWDHKTAKELRAINEIIVELVDENTIVAPHATIYDASGNEVARFTDGLPAKVAFSMPSNSPHFELEVGDTRLKQVVSTS